MTALMRRWRDRSEWLHERWLHAGRTADAGLLASFDWKVTLDATDGGTLVRHEIVMVPRSRLALLVLTLGSLRRLDERLQSAEQTLKAWSRGLIDHPFPTKRNIPPREYGQLSDRAMLADGTDYGHGQVSRLLRWVLAAQRCDIDPIQPGRLAMFWKQNIDDVVEVLLAASKAGLLVRRWALQCRACGASSAVGRLGDLVNSRDCYSCGKPTEVDLSRNVELVFAIAEPIPRTLNVTAKATSIASPNSLARLSVEANKRLTTQWNPGRRQLFMRIEGQKTEHGLHLANGDGLAIKVRGDELIASRQPERDGRLEVTNPQNEVRTVEIRDQAGAGPNYPARRAVLLQAFVDLVGEDLPTTGTPILLGEVTVLVTDLAGLARRYHTTGSPDAFKAAAERLKNVTEIVRSCGGSLYGRIGEKVFALFPSGAAAFATSRRLAGLDAAEGALPFVGAISIGTVELSRRKDRPIAQGAAVDAAVRLIAGIERGELALATDALADAALAKLIERRHVKRIGAAGVKFRLVDPTLDGGDSQSASAA